MRRFIFTLLAVVRDHSVGPCMRRLCPTAVLPDPTRRSGGQPPTMIQPFDNGAIINTPGCRQRSNRSQTAA
jgi:hypothetical protein